MNGFLNYESDQFVFALFTGGAWTLHFRGSRFLGSAFKVQGKQPLQNLIVREINRPVVGSGNGGIEFLVGEVQPSGALVVELCECAILEFRGAISITRFKARKAHSADGILVRVDHITGPRAVC